MDTKTVLVFDICSSTVMLDALHRESELHRYHRLIRGIAEFLDREAASLSYDVYKFQGDGFILLFPDSVSADDVVLYTIRLTATCRGILADFIDEYLADVPLPRVGITCGIDRGWLLPDSVGGATEYIGRPINVACRLQASLDLPEHANRVLMTNAVRSDLVDGDLRAACYRVRRTLRSLDAAERSYFEFEPLAFERSEWSRDVVRKTFEQRMRDGLTCAARLHEVYAAVTAPSVTRNLSSVVHDLGAS